MSDSDRLQGSMLISLLQAINELPKIRDHLGAIEAALIEQGEKLGEIADRLERLERERERDILRRELAALKGLLVAQTGETT